MREEEGQEMHTQQLNGVESVGGKETRNHATAVSTSLVSLMRPVSQAFLSYMKGGCCRINLDDIEIRGPTQHNGIRKRKQNVKCEVKPIRVPDGALIPMSCLSEKAAQTSWRERYACCWRAWLERRAFTLCCMALCRSSSSCSRCVRSTSSCWTASRGQRQEERVNEYEIRGGRQEERVNEYEIRGGRQEKGVDEYDEKRTDNISRREDMQREWGHER